MKYPVWCIVILSLLLALGLAGCNAEGKIDPAGLGDPNRMSWGVMLYNAQRFLRHAWWTATFPGLAIFFIVMGFNLVGDGLNDALNPKQKGKELQ